MSIIYLVASEYEIIFMHSAFFLAQNALKHFLGQIDALIFYMLSYSSDYSSNINIQVDVFSP